MGLTSILVETLIFVLASLPLYFSVKFLKGKTSLIKTILVNLICGIVYSVIASKLGIPGRILAFFLLIWIYHEVFRLKWFKAFLAWLLQLVFIAFFYLLMFLMALLFGIGLILAIIPRIG